MRMISGIVPVSPSAFTKAMEDILDARRRKADWNAEVSCTKGRTEDVDEGSPLSSLC